MLSKFPILFLCIGFCWHQIDASTSGNGLAEENPLSKTLEDLLADAKGSDPEIRLQAISKLRQMLTQAKNLPIDQVIKSGFLPILVEGLQSEDLKMQYQSAWALTNIASGNSEQTKAVVDGGAVPHLIRLLSSADNSVYEQAAWALANIIGDGSHYRDMCVELGLIDYLQKLFDSDISLSFKRTLTWMMVNLVRPKDKQLEPRYIKQMLPMLEELLHQDDEQTLKDTLWAFAYITDAGKEYIQLVIDAGIVPELAVFLKSKEPEVLTPSLRVVGNIATGTDSQTQSVLDANVLDYMPSLLWNSDEKINKEAMWFLSNIAAGTADQIQMLINADLLPMIIDLLEHADLLTQKEATWAVSNIATKRNVEQVQKMLENGVVEALCPMLKISDEKIVKITLEGLGNIVVTLPKKRKHITMKLVKCGGLEEVNKLRADKNNHLSGLADHLTTKLFAKKSYGNGDSAFDWFKTSFEQLAL